MSHLRETVIEVLRQYSVRPGAHRMLKQGLYVLGQTISQLDESSLQKAIDELLALADAIRTASELDRQGAVRGYDGKRENYARAQVTGVQKIRRGA